MTKDLVRPDLSSLDWAPERRAASLNAVFEHAVGLSNTAEAWYARKRPTKKRWGRALRVAALVLGTLAAVLPILSEISADDGRPTIPPGWSAVALACAAALVSLDHYFGFSAAWMRFMAAEMRLTRLRHDFEYAWNAQRAAATAGQTDEDAAALLTLARNFVLAVDQAVSDETDSWVTEFRGGLERVERGLAASPRG